MAESNKYEVQVTRDVKVPMRDGVLLSADIYRPKGEEAFPSIIVRTPYGKTSDVIHNNGCFFAENGYSVMYMDVRGRGDSDGVFVPYRNDGIDGYDAIEWMAAQPWSTGKVGTLGGSYLGRIQWLTALTHPPSLKTMVPLVTPSDPFVEWPTGLPNTQHICWTYMTSGRVMQNVDVVNWNEVYEHLPFIDMDEKAGRRSEQWREEISHPYLDEWWKHICYQDKFDQIDLPVLHISGWYDDEQIGTPLNFIGMTRGNGKGNGEDYKERDARPYQRLLMGPWPHQLNRSTKIGQLDFGPSALIDMNQYQLRWFDHWLKGIENGVNEEPPVDIFIMGDNEWRQESNWPLARTKWTSFYFHSIGKANSRFGDGVLLEKAPSGVTPEEGAKGKADFDQYLYDPANPVPFITEMVSSQIGGPDDYSSVERRDDVLVYTTAALSDDVEVTGPVKAELFGSTDALDTDFMVKLIDVWPNGYAQRLTDGMVRGRFRNGMDSPELLEPGKIYKFEVDCWNTAHVFKKGHKIRVEVASSAFPKYDRNLNTGAELGVTTEMKVANQTIYHDEMHPSSIILPIIPR
ncbi:CocE/NonD family hydrolase [Bacillus alkalicola]|uniref:CocE/NonD family hydrolase n=2 Tax=Bacillales TaxID=1385 RepID=A0ABS6JXE3_9BACI|nr:CocE/NonD family hydrolase [Bacillus alkalicola]